MPGLDEHNAIFARDRGAIGRALDCEQFVNARHKALRIWNYILDQETEAQSMFIVSEPEHLLYMVIGLTHEIVHLPRRGKGGDKFWAYLNQRYGLNEHDRITPFVYDNLRTYAWQHGIHVEIRRFSAFKNGIAYLSGYDGTMWRIDGEHVLRVPNGEDDVFFVDDDGGGHIEPDVDQHDVMFSSLADLHFADKGLGGISAEQMKMALIIWLFALGLPDHMPTKPLLILEGPPGAGKSLSVQLIQLALMGNIKAMILSRSKEDDFGVVLLRSPIAVFDNTDSYIEWVPDAICAYTTRGTWTKRRFYTDNEEITIRPHAFIAVASKNPASFRREDTADRCIILRLERFGADEFRDAKELEKNVADLRSQIFGEYLWYLNKIVAEIKRGALEAARKTSFRMADFASLGFVVGRVLGWPIEDVEALMHALQSERDAFINEEDPLVDILNKWIVYKPKDGPRNIGREIGLHQLFTELESVAQAMGIPFYKNARLLAQKLRSPHLERDFIVQTLTVDGHKSYRLWRKTDARLEVVHSDRKDDKKTL